MTYPVPTFVRIEYWSAERQDWSVGHHGTNLMNPQKYVQKVMDGGKAIPRAIDVDTGEVFYPEGADLL